MLALAVKVPVSCVPSLAQGGDTADALRYRLLLTPRFEGDLVGSPHAGVAMVMF